MNQNDSIQDGSFIYIKHFKTKNFLRAIAHSYKKQKDDFYLGTTPQVDDKYNIFQIKTLYGHSPNIKYGDLVSLQNFCTLKYVTEIFEKKSFVTKQGRVLLCQDDIPQQWLLQPVFDLVQSPKTQILESIVGKQVRIINSYNGSALHSHQHSYPEFKQYNEVTTFRDKDDNDFWEIVLVPEADLLKIQLNYQRRPSQIEKPLINSGVYAAIRNYWHGYTLHSHERQYKNGTQEVTTSRTEKQNMIKYENWRDHNDWWQIKNTTDTEKTLGQQSSVIFRHRETNSFLTHITGNKTSSKSLYQVTCLPGAAPESHWIIVPVKNQNQNLLIDEYFLIIHKISGHYLRSTLEPSEKTNNQHEVGLSEEFNSQCVWILEFVK
ncbi:hypothetical protein pb186bvf_017736 [Paramecium bursaria]